MYFDNILERKANKIMKADMRKTNVKMNLMKAFAIFAVVCTHCRAVG